MMMYAAHASVSSSLARVLLSTTSPCAFLASLSNFASSQLQTVVGVGLLNLIEKLTNTKNTVYYIERTDRSCTRIFSKSYLKISPETSRSECFVYFAYVSTKARVCFHRICIGNTIWIEANSWLQYLLVTQNLSPLLTFLSICVNCFIQLRRSIRHKKHTRGFFTVCENSLSCFASTPSIRSAIQVAGSEERRSTLPTFQRDLAAPVYPQFSPKPNLQHGLDLRFRQWGTWHLFGKLLCISYECYIMILFLGSNQFTYYRFSKVKCGQMYLVNFVRC